MPGATEVLAVTLQVWPGRSVHHGVVLHLLLHAA